MIKVTDIITANFTQVEELLSKDYVCVSVVGKVYEEVKGKEQIERIRNLNTFRFYYHIRSKDYYACYHLYRDILERKGIKKLLEEIKELLYKYNKTKIALCDNSIGKEFGFRHILRSFLLENSISVTDIENVNLELQKEFWRQDTYKQAGHFNLTDDFVGQILEKQKWTFAKTLPQNPHFYLTRSKEDENKLNSDLFVKIVYHIRFFGQPEIYEGVFYRVFYYNAYKYWTMPQDLKNEDCNLINRQFCNQPKFYEKKYTL